MTHTRTCTLFAAAFILALSTPLALAQSNILPDKKFAWGENIGWTNWRDANAGAQGVRVLDDHLTGFIWAENVGWINTGNGAGPYANTHGTNFGVNILSNGLLDGFAWGENIGWVNFGTEPFIGAQGARYDASAGRFRGYAWAENVGWINLDDSTHFIGVATCTGDINGDGVVNGQDLATLLTAWCTTPGCASGHPADLNGDGVVNGQDLATLLTNWGPCD